MIKTLPLIYLLAFFSFKLIAQQKTVVNKQNFNSPTIGKGVFAPTAIAGNMACYGYLANITQTIDITLNVNNPDSEYLDSLAITFPAGITPISSPNNTFPTINNNGGFCNYNGVIGQTITWGENNNDLYGGVYGNNLNFKVVVSAANLSSIVTASFHLSGDGYNGGGAPADLNGTFQIKPKVAVDYRIIDFSVPLVGCVNTNSELMKVRLRNDGYNSAVGTTTLSYKINNSPLVVETTTLVTVANDTLTYYFNASGDFAIFSTYTVIANVANALDLNSTNNSSTRYTQTFPKNTLPYQTGCEATPPLDLLNWYLDNVDSPFTWDTTNLIPHSGKVCFRMLETTPTTCEDYLFSPCLDMEVGKTYQLSYWRRLTSGYVGSLGVFLLKAQNTDSIQQLLKSPASLTANSIWEKDSVSFTVPKNGIFHIGFLALNYTEEIIALRLDDILIKDLNALASVGSYELEEISVFPNPTKDILTVYSPNSALNIEFVNAIGQTITHIELKNLGKNQIDVSNLANGVYLMKLINNRNIAYRKIIKQ